MPLTVDATGNQLTYQIIGAAMTVHNALGPGYKEEVYEKALFAELDQRGLAVQRQAQVEVWHAEMQTGLFFLDLLVEDQVIVEIKAFSHLLTHDELAQVVNYLKAAQKPVGLLLNFGRGKLEYKRIYPSRDTQEEIQRIGRDNALKKY